MSMTRDLRDKYVQLMNLIHASLYRFILILLPSFDRFLIASGLDKALDISQIDKYYMSGKV